MAENEWLSKDFYKVLGVSKDATGRRNHQSVPQAGAQIPSRPEQDQGSGGEVQGHLRSVRRAEQQGESPEVRCDPPVRHGRRAFRRRFRPGRLRRGRVSPTSSARCSAAAQAWAATARVSASQTTGGGSEPQRHLLDVRRAAGQGGQPYGAGSRRTATLGGYGYEEAPRPENGEDRNSKISLTLRQAVKGATVSLSVDGKKFKAHVPAGVKDGQKIKLAGKGKPGINGGKNGDLYLHVTVPKTRNSPDARP